METQPWTSAEDLDGWYSDGGQHSQVLAYGALQGQDANRRGDRGASRARRGGALDGFHLAEPFP